MKNGKNEIRRCLADQACAWNLVRNLWSLFWRTALGKCAWKKKALTAINAIQSFYLYARLFRARAFCPSCPDGYYISIIPEELFCLESEYALFYLISLLAGFLPSPWIKSALAGIYVCALTFAAHLDGRLISGREIAEAFFFRAFGKT